MKLQYSSRKAFTIVEIMVCGFIVALIALIGPTFDHAMRVQILNVENRFDAMSLANAQIEELRSIAKTVGFTAAAELQGSGAIGVASGSYDATIPDIRPGFDLSYTVTDRNWDGSLSVEYKEITVTVTYGAGSHVDLVSYIANISH
ncbi:MAG: hypothetical protein D4S01_04840 [Dehalococcoidia bacterium]|nr:MAG: hypothetical protein D4S01_04840 [Dehalococcoidia bacterium]